MKKNSSLISKFKIEKMFGLYDVNINFEDNINIFIGENGIGKTTILNCIFYVLKGNISELCKIDFKKIEIQIGENRLEIKHDLLSNYNETISEEYYDDYSDAKISDFIFQIAGYISKDNLKRINNEKVRDAIVNKIKKNEHILLSRYQISKIIDKINDDYILNWSAIVKAYANTLIFLPTYRRIEEDFGDLAKFEKRYSKRFTNKNGLYFGMKDVEIGIEKTCSELKSMTNEGFKKMTSDLLNGYVELDKGIKKITRVKKIKNDELNLMFERLADQIDRKTRDAIIENYINNSKSDEFKDNYLDKIIQSLHNIYNTTRKLDENLEDFINVCNKYLTSCKLVYDKFKIECKLINTANNKEIDFNCLSSGEKQIVSIFAKVYLSSNTNNIVLFDEPELSLSIIWQETLIPDIISSKKCSFMMIVTHSPYIIKNECQNYARIMSEYIRKK